MKLRIPKLIVSVLVYAFDEVCSLLGTWIGKPSEGRAVVLYYHAVRDRERDRFARQMELLTLRAIAFPVESPPRLEVGRLYAAVTFDDGFVCVARNAIPVLAARNIPVMIFVPVGSLGTTPSWISGTGHPDSFEIVMTNEELQGLAQLPGVSIGSHCLTHRNLMILDDKDSRREIRESKIRLEEISGMEVHSLSFPHGAYDERHTAMSFEAGYKNLFSISPALYRSTDSIKGRVKADPSDWPVEFQLKLAGAYRWFHKISTMKQKWLGYQH